MGIESGYAICLNKWALNKSIKNDLRLLLIISSLTAEKGYCFASNSYLAKIFNEDECTISRKIKNLENNKIIEIEYIKTHGCEVSERRIRLTEISIDDCQKYQSTIDENVKDNNISNINNISTNNKEKDNIIINNNIIQKERRKSTFKIPTLEEVQKYITEKKLDINAKQFIDYYEEGNWCDSKGNKVKNWKQKLLTWNGRRNKNTSSNRQTTYVPTNTEDTEVWLGTEEELYDYMKKQKGE